MSKYSTILVVVQTITMIYLLIINPQIIVGLGLIIQIFGIALGIWGILIMRVSDFNIQPEVKSSSLITTGPYKWIRNPMYVAVILFYLPIVIKHFKWINSLVFMALLITLLLKIKSEEEFLLERFGKDYSDYKKETKRFIPFIF